MYFPERLILVFKTGIKSLDFRHFCKELWPVYISPKTKSPPGTCGDPNYMLTHALLCSVIYVLNVYRFLELWNCLRELFILCLE